MRQHIYLIGIVFGALLLAACGSSAAAISVRDPWARAAAMTGASTTGAAPEAHTGTMSGTMTMGAEAAPGGGTSAAYLTISNAGGSADALIGAASDVADTVELHTMTMEGDVMRMSPVEKVDIPANGTVELKPGGLHVMLIGLRRDLVDGEVVKLTLTFQNAGAVEVEAPVRRP